MNKLILAFGFLLLLIGCLSCTTQRKAEKWMNEHHLEASAYCADKFPVQTDTQYIKGETIYDTIFEPVEIIDTFACPPSDTVVRYQIKIQTKKERVTEVRTDTLIEWRENLAKVVELDLTLQQTNEELKQAKKEASTSGKTVYWLIGIVLLMAFWIFRKPILRLMTGVGF